RLLRDPNRLPGHVEDSNATGDEMMKLAKHGLGPTYGRRIPDVQVSDGLSWRLRLHRNHQGTESLQLAAPSAEKA
ncbi:MAG: hypothetical protein AAF411_21140, partial [Myxococcota bacterium]